MIDDSPYPWECCMKRSRQICLNLVNLVNHLALKLNNYIMQMFFSADMGKKINLDTPELFAVYKPITSYKRLILAT